MTNFQEVSRLNDVMGNPKGDINNPDWMKAKGQLLLIQEELQEMIEAIDNQDMTALRDSTADVLVTTYGQAHKMGIDADADMKEVQSSNMSKLCTTAQELLDTTKHYSDMGVKVYASGVIPEACVKSAEDQVVNGKFYPAHKFLKCVNWKEPNLS